MTDSRGTDTQREMTYSATQTLRAPPTAFGEKKGEWRGTASPDLQGRRRQESAGVWATIQKPASEWVKQDPGPAQHRATSLERKGAQH